MQRTCVDTIGPVTVSDNESNDTEKFALVIIDAFSGHMNLCATKDTTAKAALKALTDWVATFGCPLETVSDSGSQLVNELTSELTDATHTERGLIHAHSKEESGLVERANREVSRHTTAVVFSTLVKKEWVHNRVHTSVGVPPSQLTFGSSVSHDANILIPLEVKEQGT